MRLTLILAGFASGHGSCSHQQAIPASAIQHADTDVRGLRHEIAFHPARGNAAACFVATLENDSGRNLNLRLDDKKFQAPLKFRTSQGREFEACDQDYLRLLMCASWIDPVVKLPVGNRIRWMLLLESVVTLDCESVSTESLHNATVVSELPVSGTILNPNESGSPGPIPSGPKRDNPVDDHQLDCRVKAGCDC